jgi:NAD(P)-dependent dehydrogenase (short-subunit alcohol dehydrogenase family)
MKNDRFTNKTILITGGNSGLGLATAERLVTEDARVIITGRNKESLDAAVKKLGSQAEGIVTDVTRTSDLDALYAHLSKTYSKLDGLFANAGIAIFGSLETFSENDYDAMFDTNVRGLFFTVQKAITMLAKGSSVVLNASSTASRGRATTAAYGATKAAVRSLARTFSQALLERGIRVNAVSPGPIDTPLWEGTPDAGKEAVRQANPSKRFGKADEVASAVAFLLSDESAYTVGAEIPVDGGYTQL